MYDEKNHRFLSLSSLYSYYTGAIDDVPINGLKVKVNICRCLSSRSLYGLSFVVMY